MSESFIGAYVSIITYSSIRYEGTLVKINKEEKTITLENVRIMGTEGRKKEGPQIPASDNLYKLLEFRGTDIESINVTETPSQTPMINDPAIVAAAPQEPEAQEETTDDHASAWGTSGSRQRIARGPGEKSSGVGFRRTREGRGGWAAPETSARAQGAKAKPGTGKHLLQASEWRPYDSEKRPENSANDFDFQAGLKQFDKDALKAEMDNLSLNNTNEGQEETEEQSGKAKPVPLYNPGKSFFDSAPTEEPSAGTANGTKRYQQRRTNIETFGASGLSREGYRGRGGHRGRGGYRGRGGRGGHGGFRGGRGGHNHHNDGAKFSHGGYHHNRRGNSYGKDHKGGYFNRGYDNSQKSHIDKKNAETFGN